MISTSFWLSSLPHRLGTSNSNHFIIKSLSTRLFLFIQCVPKLHLSFLFFRFYQWRRKMLFKITCYISSFSKNMLFNIYIFDSSIWKEKNVASGSENFSQNASRYLRQMCFKLHRYYDYFNKILKQDKCQDAHGSLENLQLWLLIWNHFKTTKERFLPVNTALSSLSFISTENTQRQ